MISNKTQHGYQNARHMFGRSQLVRNGNQSYYLLWQWSRKSNPVDLVSFDHKLYDKIKSLLLPVKHFQIILPNSIVYYHARSANNYAKLKRFLKKNKLIEED